jgi:gliding motility-associated-like protein
MTIFKISTNKVRCVIRATIMFVVVFCLLYASPLSAKHLVGGSVTYKFISTSNGLYHFQVTVDAFRDCSDQTAPALDNSIVIGIYEHTTTGDKRLFDTITFFISTLETVEPVSGGSGCSFHPSSCLQHGKYIGNINLPASVYGYDLIYLRCCRNVMVNLPQSSGYNYYAFIAPTSFKNSSPAFNDVPVPYICANDTVTLNFSASDPNGDSISYKIAWPYSGASASGNPAPLPPDPFSEPEKVSYNTFYSYLQPFGPQGVCKIGKTNGLLTVYAIKSGNYAIAVDYYEYRKGKLFDSTRRDVQFIVLNCPYNPAPTRKAINGNTSTDFYVQAGETIDFNFAFSDPNFNALKLTALGSLFSKSINPAILTILPNKDSFNVTANVKWKSVCTDVSPAPYSFIVKIQDNGCPPKTTYQTLNIYVLPPPIPKAIYGPQSACGLGDTFKYFAFPALNAHLAWKVDGGKIISIKNDTILIRWNSNVRQATIKVVNITPTGCVSDTFNEVINMFPKPPPSILTGPGEVCIKNAVTFEVSRSTYTTFVWNYGDARLLQDNNSSIQLMWNRKGPAFVKVVEIDAHGCFSDSLKMKINVGAPLADSIFGPVSVCPNSKNIDYVTSSQPGSTYTWQITGGVQASGGNGNHIKVNWGNKGPGTVSAIEKTIGGCIGDTVTLPVTIDYLLHTPPIRGDSTLCEMSAAKIYRVLNSNNSKYAWTVSGGSIASGQGSCKITVNWGSAGNGFITCQETAYDSINHEPCIGSPISLPVILDSLPRTSAISGPGMACVKTTNFYKVTGLKNSKYIWKIDNPALVINNQGADSISVYFSVAGSYKLSVQEISKDSCPGAVQTMPIFIDGMPNTGDIQGPQNVCTPYLTSIVYTVKGGLKSSFAWTIDGGVIVTGTGTNHITVDWYMAGSRKISVIETSAFGCPGLEKSIFVTVDSLILVMDLVTTVRSNDNQVQVYWHALNNQFLTGNIYLYRSANPGRDGYRLIASMPPDKATWIDKNVSTHETAYYYKIGALNSCNAMVWSNVHRTILLKDMGHINDSSYMLKWNSYVGWPEGVASYNTFKTSDMDTTLRFFNFGADSTAQVSTDLIGYRQCFRIGATRRGQSNMVSWSNNICVDVDPYLWIPNTFTPNGDNTNNTWKIFVSNYKNFRVDIYNRWGEHIFTSNDPGQQWDGRFKGMPSPEGVYLYMVQVGGATGNIYRNGTLNLLK